MAQGIMMTPFLKLTGSCLHPNFPGNSCLLAPCHYATKKGIIWKKDLLKITKVKKSLNEKFVGIINL